MDKRSVLAIIRRFRRALEKRGVEAPRIVLFGSWANGTAHPGSDIDLVVISETFQGKGYWERIDILTDAVYELFEPIEAVAFTPEEWERGDSLIADLARAGEAQE
ncbi:MAG TPA: nucleotidyltransferase domain-containing protein [Planctomycetota bacterium]|nr:nucleotidyltransferase domain-containing protein [Planctomycetota bacterium]HRR80762.1 nucleotidyltransferase domain-containing protein [Planctomycetota bacterium]HRT95074.1 nucleotidyltransferase domain-containing protein [Planctomycetota bacterium]